MVFVSLSVDFAVRAICCNGIVAYSATTVKEQKSRKSGYNYPVLDFYASQSNLIDHLAPVWNALDREHRGLFYIADSLRAHAGRKISIGDLYFIEKKILPESSLPILTAGYGDMLNAWKQNPGRTLIRMEHGVGIAFGTAGYADGRGRRDKAALYLMPNEYLAARHRAVHDIPAYVIGTPKMDWIKGNQEVIRSDHQTVCISFHWGDRNTNPPESGSAFQHYQAVIPELAKRFRLIGHGHPFEQEKYRLYFESNGIEFVDDFDDVMRRAALYVGDISSTIYEFVLTGKPVILLNAPWFRRDKQYGLRFWDYSDIGPQVNEPAELGTMIEYTLENFDTHLAARLRAAMDLYSYFGISAERATNVLIEFLEKRLAV